MNEREEQQPFSVEDTEVALARMRLFLSPHAKPETENRLKSLQNTEANDEDAMSSRTASDLSEHEEEGTIPRPGEVATVRALSAISKEYLRVKYLLQASLPGYKLADQIAIYDMRNPSLSSQYEQYTSGMLELDSWVAVTDLGPETSMKDVYSCGFTSPKSQRGMKLSTGNLLLENPGSSGRRQYVLCKVAVGRSAVIDEECSLQRLPPGYNSFYLNQKENKKNSYYHEYILPNPLQVLPQYLVQFSYKAQQAPSKTLCALCEKKNVSLSCKACDAGLCRECDQEVHSANKLVAKHKRVELNENIINGSTPLEETEIASLKTKFQALSSNSNCSKHPDISVEFYCRTCSIPVCVHCKMVGDHSCGEASSHRLISILDAYENVLRESSRQDPLIDSRKRVIGDKLHMVSDRVEEIRTNTQMIEKVIRKKMEEALESLENQSKSKLAVLKGEELELKRQQEHIDWAESFLCQQRRLLDPVSFLNVWNQHKILRTELRDFPVLFAANAENVRGDLQLHGTLQVIAGESTNNNGQNFPPSSSASNGTNDAEMRKKLLTSKSLKPLSFQNKGAENSSRITNLMSPKSSELIAKVKSDLTSGITTGSLTLKSNDSRELSTTISKKRAPHQRQKTCHDIWTTHLREEMAVNK